MSYIGVDLDGTLAEYDGWRGVKHIGPPVAQMLARVKEWISDGLEVKIFTARADKKRGIEFYGDSIAAIRAWLKHNGLPELEITNEKGFEMIELWDDRAVCVELNTGRILGRNTIYQRGK